MRPGARHSQHRAPSPGGKDLRAGWTPQSFLPAGAMLRGSSLEWPEGASKVPGGESSFTLSRMVFLMAAGETFSRSATDCSSLGRQRGGLCPGLRLLPSPGVQVEVARSAQLPAPASLGCCCAVTPTLGPLPLHFPPPATSPLDCRSAATHLIQASSGSPNLPAAPQTLSPHDPEHGTHASSVSPAGWCQESSITF